MAIFIPTYKSKTRAQQIFHMLTTLQPPNYLITKKSMQQNNLLSHIHRFSSRQCSKMQV